MESPPDCAERTTVPTGTKGPICDTFSRIKGRACIQAVPDIDGTMGLLKP